MSASSAAPTGIERPPASAITPFMPTTTPGVANPCTISSAVVVEKAVPSRITRPSRPRTPAAVSPIATKAAVPPAVTTGQKWASEERSTGCRPTTAMIRSGHRRGGGREQVPGPEPLVPCATHPGSYRLECAGV